MKLRLSIIITLTLGDVLLMMGGIGMHNVLSATMKSVGDGVSSVREHNFRSQMGFEAGLLWAQMIQIGSRDLRCSC